MSDDSDGWHASTDESYRRRDVLGALGAAGALAGCSSDGGGGDGGNGGGDSADTDGGGGGGETEPNAMDDGAGGAQSDPTATTSGSDGAGSGSGGGDGRVNCSSPSFAYTTATFTPSTGDATLQTSVPERASVRKTTGLMVQINYQNYQTDALVLNATYMMAGTVDDAADGMTGEEVTDRYDPAVSGTRVFRSSLDEGSRILRVLLPAEEAYYNVRMTIGERACPDGTAVAATEMINTLQPVE